jgi:hypothetical protein
MNNNNRYNRNKPKFSKTTQNGGDSTDRDRNRRNYNHYNNYKRNYSVSHRNGNHRRNMNIRHIEQSQKSSSLSPLNPNYRPPAPVSIYPNHSTATVHSNRSLSFHSQSPIHSNNNDMNRNDNTHNYSEYEKDDDDDNLRSNTNNQLNKPIRWGVEDPYENGD